jgi:SAM-dependent methyltransferase
VRRYHLVAERDHDIQNPTSAEKIRLLGTLLELAPDRRVLDIACGRGGPAIVLASTFGCRITGVERASDFAAAARERVAEAGLAALVEIVEADAREFALEPESWDVAVCLGATFVWDDLAGTLAAVVPALRPGGHAAVGEPYWREEPPAETGDMGFVSLEETIRRFELAGLITVGLVAASTDDWDRYESLQWRAVESWLAEHPGDAGAAELRRERDEYRQRYVEVLRRRLGWAMIAGRKLG